MVSARLRLRRVLAVTKYGPCCKTIKLRSINKIIYGSHIIFAVTITVSTVVDDGVDLKGIHFHSSNYSSITADGKENNELKTSLK